MVELAAHLILGKDGRAIGKDPRTLSVAEFKALGHKAMSAAKAIRAKCLDCCVGEASEVLKCTAFKCPSWPYRLGKSPWHQKRKVRAGTRLNPPQNNTSVETAGGV